MKNKRNYIMLFLLILVSFLATSIGFNFIFNKGLTENNKTIEKEDPPIESISEDKILSKDELEEEIIKKDKKVKILAAGDLMYHMPQVRAAKGLNGQEYSFDNNYKYIKSYAESSDLSIVNLETVTAGNNKGFSGFPSFNSPLETIDAIKSSGFNIVNLANNHILDQGYEGILSTIDRIEANNLDYVGASREYENKHIIKTVDDMKIGFLSYSYGFNGNEERYSNDRLYSFVNKIDLDKIRKDIDLLNKEKVDFIITYLHWGNEYITTPSQSQKKLKDELFEMGVDVILGSHPHVVQTSEFIGNEDNDKFIIYSMGNFISNQRKEIMKNPYTEDGLMINLELVKTHDGRKKIENIKYIPTWVYKYKTDRDNYEIIPIEDALEGKIQVYRYEGIIKNLTDSYNRTMEIINQ